VLFVRYAQAAEGDGRTPMPKYEFLCTSCKKSFERLLTVAERAIAKSRCPKCGSRAVTPQMAIFTARTSRKG